MKSINDIEKIIKDNLNDENIKIHKLTSEKEKFLVVSKEEENNSYSFYTPVFSNLDTNSPKVNLTPIENIFDYLEDNNINMELPNTENESDETYGRGK